MNAPAANQHSAPGRRRRLAMWLAAALVAGIVVTTSYKAIAPPSDEQLMALLIERAKIEPIPADARMIELKVSGSMFTRTITATFTAADDSIRLWLDRSPGPSGATPETYSDGKVGYIYDGGGGANRAYIFIDKAASTVTVEAAWS